VNGNPIIISHRGNLRGPCREAENNPAYLEMARDAVGNVETDVWWRDGCFWLGHDAPQFCVSLSWLEQPWLWCHAKNTDTVGPLLSAGVHVFWHENDLLTLTSRGIPWCQPGVYLRNGVTVLFGAVFPENAVLGYCSDYAGEYICK